MRLEQSFEVAAPLERVWQTLIDVEHVAPCLPGAAVTGRNDDGSYNGTFTVKIGPTTASYTGKLEMQNVDEFSHTATMQAQGTDKRGQGGAKATILSRLAPVDGNGTRVEVVTDYHITGRLARFGRGGMIEDISERLLREFAKRLQSSLAAQPEAPAAPAVAQTVVSSRPEEPVADTVVSPRPATPPTEPPTEVAEPAAEAASPQEPAPFRTDWVPPSTHDTAHTPAPGAPQPAAQQAPAEHPSEPGPAAEQAPAEHPSEPEPAAEQAPAEHPSEPEPAAEPAAAEHPSEPAVTASGEPAAPAPPVPEPPPVAPPPPSAAGQMPPLDNPPMPSEPMQGLSLVGSVVWGRVKRNPAPVAAAGVAVVLLMARRRRRRHGR